MKLKLVLFALLFLLCQHFVFPQVNADVSNISSVYVGRYDLRPDVVFEVKKDGNLLTLLPSFWGSAIILDSIGKDKFESLLHPQTKFEFKRDSNGIITEVVSTGNREIEGVARKLPKKEYKVVELLLNGRGKEAKAKLEHPSEEISSERIVRLGFNMLRFRPSKAQGTRDFLSAFASKYPKSVDLQQLLGLASLMIDDRQTALNSFRKAFELNPEDAMSSSAVRLLDPENAAPAPKQSWKIPFDIDQLFHPPSQSEIERVLEDWKERHLAEKNSEVVHEESSESDGFLIRVIRHSVNGRIHYGAVLVPKGSKSRTLPIVLELHGVDARYSPFDVRKAKVPKILGEDGPQAIVAIPSFRGNTLVVGDKTFVSDGSPRDAWDGAADDAIAFLNTVIRKQPEADPARISAFGKSRGGTVAMLVGVRDKRIGSVVNWAGPSGWFSEMGTYGWSLKQQVQWGLWEKWEPGRGWGSASQFIDWFLAESVETQEGSIKEIRHRILASSPIYFLERLPSAEFHYGLNDGGVPIANAYALQNVLSARNKSAPEFTIHIHNNAGHDQPYPRAYDLSREFIREQLTR